MVANKIALTLKFNIKQMWFIHSCVDLGARVMLTTVAYSINVKNVTQATRVQFQPNFIFFYIRKCTNSILILLPLHI